MLSLDNFMVNDHFTEDIETLFTLQVDIFGCAVSGHQTGKGARRDSVI